MFLPSPEEPGFKPCPPGQHVAICYRFVDLGTQRFHHPGQIIDQHKVLLSWELPETAIPEGEHAGQPYCFHQQYTWSMHEKATLRKHLESWRGVPFGPSDFGDGGCDIRDILGKTCVLTLIANRGNSRGGVKLQIISRLPRSAKAPESPRNPVYYLSLEPQRFDYLTFKMLSPNLQETVRRSPEFRKLMHLPKVAENSDRPPPPTCASALHLHTKLGSHVLQAPVATASKFPQRSHTSRRSPV